MTEATEIRPAPHKFSIVIPTHGEPDALEGTIRTLFVQEVRAVERYELEVLIVGDGFNQRTKQLVDESARLARDQGLRMYFFYFSAQKPTGNGNIMRNHGLLKATNDWVMFLDQGVACCWSMFRQICGALDTFPEAQIVSWDMLQNTFPVPTVTTTTAIEGAISRANTEGVGYIFPGCATMCRREPAQELGWPTDVKASDFAFFSLLFHKLFGEPGFFRPEDANNGTVLIPWTLCMAYAYGPTKERWPMTREEFLKQGYDRRYLPSEPAEGEAA